MINTEGMIEITGCDLVKVVKTAYAISQPVGMGFLHFKEGGLSDEQAISLIDSDHWRGIVVDMDYVNGRQCKFSVYKVDDKLFIRNKWYDHSDEQLKQLLEEIKPVAA